MEKNEHGKMRVKIHLDTMQSINEFVSLVTPIEGEINVLDNKNHVVNAKSLLGMIYAMEFEELWCESEEDIYTIIEKFVVV